MSAIFRFIYSGLVLFLLQSSVYAADSTSFDPVPVAITAESSSGVPIGTIVSWPIHSMPSGTEAGKWLECNGQSTAGYPMLAALIGGNVPNYQGIFLRGYGSQTSYHWGAVGHSSGALGQMQGDAIRNITGSFEYKPRRYGGLTPSGVFRTLSSTGSTGDTGPDAPSATEFNAALVVPTAYENRPINKSVKYIMKAKP